MTPVPFIVLFIFSPLFSLFSAMFTLKTVDMLT